MVSRLPITIRPAHQEIAVSYLAWLAALHDMSVEDLWQQASRPKAKGSPTRRLDGDLLATQPRHRLERAIVEPRTPKPDWLALRHQPQRGCRRCDARHPGGPVLHLLGHRTYVCTRHQVWIGPPDQVDHPQPSLAGLPEVVAAQHRHLRLLRRVSPAATFDAVLTGFLICAQRWNFADLDTAADSDAWHEWDRRADLFTPPGAESETFSASRLFAASYPKRSRSPSSSDRCAGGARPPAGRTTSAFAAEIGRRLGQHDYRPLAFKDPIARWREQDCWQSPSLPHTDTAASRLSADPRSASPPPAATRSAAPARSGSAATTAAAARCCTTAPSLRWSRATDRSSASCSPRRSKSPRTPTRNRASR
ncbi:hypothetical protein [Goodfellowiella coeruleoviolacea]|nr:hypothetical protein [Goodfellowiella coeruleoviolacea]